MCGCQQHEPVLQSSPNGKDSPPHILSVGCVCGLVSPTPSSFPTDRAQSWSSSHHTAWKSHLSPGPLPTLLGELNAPENGEIHAPENGEINAPEDGEINVPFVPGQFQQDYLTFVT